MTYRPLPPAMRAALLHILTLGYGPSARQRHDAPDHVVAWQVQSMLDDYAEAYDPDDFESSVTQAERGFAPVQQAAE